jgi:dienelactone hydrolase
MMRKWIFFFVALLARINSSFADEWQSIPVRKTFDNRPFAYLEKTLAERPGYKILRLKYPSPMTTAIEQNNTIPADYYLPDGIRSGEPGRPAVICLHILDGNDVLTDMVCSTLAARGIPAIAFKMPYYGERGLPEGPIAMARNPKLFAGAIEQTGADVRRTFDLLASRDEVDPRKIGITGISLGGIVAASSAGGEPRIHRAALLMAGGDVLSIIHFARETAPLSETIKALPADERAALEGKIKDLDPLKFAPALRDRAQKGFVLMINAAEDEVIPKKCTEKLADALAIPDKILWLDGLGHYSAAAEMPFALKTTADFFARDLPPGVRPPSVESRKPELQKLAEVTRQTAALLAEKPEAGKLHAVDLKISIQSGKEKPLESRLAIRRDSGKRFSLSCKLPILGNLAFGQGDSPWIVSNGTVLAGSENAAALKGLQDFIPSREQLRLRMLAGLLKASAATPEVLLRFVGVENDPQADGKPGISFVGKEPISGRVGMSFKADGTLSQIKIETAELKATVDFLEVRINAPARPDSFSPPADMLVKKVEQKEVYRMIEGLLAIAESMGGN